MTQCSKKQRICDIRQHRKQRPLDRMPARPRQPNSQRPNRAASSLRKGKFAFNTGGTKRAVQACRNATTPHTKGRMMAKGVTGQKGRNMRAMHQTSPGDLCTKM